ncbi:hypothetical protein [Streptomyces sp. NPDC093591]|uniref:hypothetical protein n=1 Tax=Streptomyces sp. NPDC093591 TaxID=3366044 RepID=UPI003802514C
MSTIERELSALLVTASPRELIAGGALVVDGADELLDEDSPSPPGGYDPHREAVAAGLERGSVVSLEAPRLPAEEHAAGRSEGSAA